MAFFLDKTSVFDLFKDTWLKNSQVESSWEWQVSTILDCTWHCISVSVACIHLRDFKDSSLPWSHCRVKQPVHLLLPLFLKLSIDICTNEPTEVLCLTKHPPLYHTPVEVLCKALGSQMEVLPSLCGVLRCYAWEQTKDCMFQIMYVLLMLSASMCGSILHDLCLKIRGMGVFKDISCGQNWCREVLSSSQI